MPLKMLHNTKTAYQPGLSSIGAEIAMHSTCSKKQSVLVIDDSIITLEILSGLIGDEFDVLVSTSGNEGLLLAQSELPDLILLDVVMPDLDGFDVLSHLKANTRTAEIPVIFLTGLDNEDNEVRGLRMGAVDYITKPFCPEIVQARVHTHLELKRSRDALRDLALIDGLTGIANRRCFNERLNQAWTKSIRTHSPISLIMADIDHFKSYNDLYGHPTGDECLVQVAKIFGNIGLRHSDLVARLGGEEFAVLLPETDNENAMLFAQRIQKKLEQWAIPHFASQVSDRITLSLGVATLCATHETLAHILFQTADEHLYMAKRRGRNQIYTHVTSKAAEKIPPELN